MSIYKKDNNLKSYILLLVSFFILVLVTKDQIFLVQENSDNNEQLNIELSEKRNNVENLNNLKNELKNNTGSLSEISKYLIDFKEDEIIDYIYSYSNENEYENWIIIKNISFSKWLTNEFGLKESNITVSVKANSEINIKKFINFLVSDDSKYKFYISSFSYPYWKVDSIISVNIPMKLFYK